MKKYSRVCAQIDLDAFLFNLEQLHHVIRGEETKIMAVIKSDGYGHGSIPLAHAMEDVPYLWGFGVATLDEASQLRKKEIANPILVLSCVFPDQYEKAIKNEIRLTVYTLEAAKELSQLATQLDMEVIIHIKIDTGMGRIGFLPTEESIRAIKEIAALPKLKIEGVYTHFARADEADKSFTRQQEEAFKFVKKRLLEEGIEPSMYHSSNSAGILDVPTAHMDLVRAGIAMYGIYPSSEVNKEEAKLKPIMSISSHVAHVKWVEEGLSISYGGTYTSKERIRVATIPVGYGDGYPRALSNKGWVLIHGQKALGYPSP